MKASILFIASLCAASQLSAQNRLSILDALSQLYRNYDPDKSTAQWDCTVGQKATPRTEGWPCTSENAEVYVSSVFFAEIGENGTDMVYLVASARPANPAGGYECHACAPAIGIAVFQAQEGNWALRSFNPAVGFYGGWGKPSQVELVWAGPERRGFMMSNRDLAQGYAWSTKALLLPIERTVAEVWSIQDEEDNTGAIDPAEKLNPTHKLNPADKLSQQAPYRSSAAFKFYNPGLEDMDADAYYDIEVISRGTDRQDLGHPVQPENWTEIYRFKDGKYRLLSHKDFTEASGPTPKPKKLP